MSNDLQANPTSQIDSIGPWRRAVMGFFAFVSSLFAALIGVGLLIAPGWAGWPRLAGDVLLFLAAFFLLVAARFWLGKRRWLDCLVNAMFAKAYWSLIVIVLLFCTVVGVGISIGLWKDIRGH